MQTLALLLLAKSLCLGSLSSESRQKNGIDDSTSSLSGSSEVAHDMTHSIFSDQTLLQSQAAGTGFSLPSHSGKFPQMDQKLSSYDDQNTDIDLDYLLFELQSTHTAMEETSFPSPYEADFATSNTLHIPMVAQSCAIQSRTGKSGVLRGNLFQMPIHMKLQQSTQFQNLWIVKFDEDTGKILPLFQKSGS